MDEKILNKIYRAGTHFLAPLGSSATYRTIIKEATRLVPSEYGSIFLFEGDRLVATFTTAPANDQVEPRKRGYSYKSIIRAKPLAVSIEQFKKVHPEFANESDAKSVLFIPLINQDKPFGVLILYSCQSEYFTREMMETLTLFGSIATLAVRKAQLYEQIRESVLARDLFISLAAHELRTPLTAISGYTQLVKNKLAARGKIKTEWVNDLAFETERMVKLVNELLDIDRAKRGNLQYSFKQGSLVAVVEKALEIFKLAHPERQVLYKNSLRPEFDVIVGDFDKLLQVMNNVLANAAKFSPNETTITVTVKTRGRDILVSVHDEGIGIPASDVERVFEDFYKGSTGREDGMGLGLFLAKNVITKHRGEIKIASQPGQGTTLNIFLPSLAGQK